MSRITRSLAAIAVIALASAGCQSSASSTGSAMTPDQVKARLADADRQDGKVDLVVANCAACKLGMLGKGDITSTMEGYTLHFCADHCKKAFDEDPKAVVAQLPSGGK